ncbi:hypothetical protein D7V80_24905 [Corallococcus sp. CA054B]|uniref:hypothetical protein n=1 Tax=Corallococcus sp. CA054B TaxID=2316734 RepID=UPI000EA25291|nr:hypothetical protein [Corallococcus sp. CA054B]RKG64966.1 hypothetical protein D7V80_24905 [Corallococcus sp. CA054B]
MARVLIVLDGGFRFSEATGTPDFTFTTLVDALVGVGHQVTKAHRQMDGSANISKFNFETSANLLDYDVIWLIGYEGRNSITSSGSSNLGIGDIEVAAISRFMAAGGGVFATGDHDSIGAEMSGRIPRVRAMRSWYGANDPASPMPTPFPRNFPSITGARADTTQRNPAGDYGADTTFVWSENQSDSVPQPITPKTSPAHPILRRHGSDITLYPDHMHEGSTLGEVLGYDYALSLSFAGESFTEFPAIAGHRETPKVIATGKTVPYASRSVNGGGFVGNNSEASGPKEVNTLSVYDGREAGVGRIVTGATFHHYVDINLTGDSSVNTPAKLVSAGPDAAKGHGFAHPGAEATFDAIKAVFVNITHWLARPRPAIQLILERSTFSQAEAAANPQFDGAILVTVDGLKPNQFPNGGITSLSPTSAQLVSWAPSLTPTDPTGLTLQPTGISSDDPMLADRLQRITFTYQVQVNGPAFGFGGNSRNIRVDASLSSPAVSNPLTNSAGIQLNKSANPFMLDLANNNTTPWLSSDVRVFRVVAGAPGSGLIDNASREQALDFLRSLVSGMTVAQFESINMNQAGSALSPFATTTGVPHRRVYNFAVARVRMPAAGASANDVRVFFRIFTSQTTAALSYIESPPGTPIEGYRRTAGPAPIALPGTNASGNEWLSFPMFSEERTTPPEKQTDPDNLKGGLAAGASTFFGALIDNNLEDAYLPPTPTSTAAPVDLPTLMMGEHQCIVAQIEYAGTPIPGGATPFTSDKLSQRNIAFSAVANPGLDASRVALHTFEIEANARPVAGGFPPDELLLDWLGEPPVGTEVRIFVPDWNAHDVVELADRTYLRHEIRALDANTVAVPGGGVRYIPIPRSDTRPTGVLSAHLPLGVKKGQRFDLCIRHVTIRRRQVGAEQPKATIISSEEAARLLQGRDGKVASARRGARQKAAVLPRGAFDIGENRVLVTDLRLLDAEGAHAVLIEHPDPKAIAEVRREAGGWREMIGAFQLGIPVTTKADMLAHHLRLLSVFRWRAEALRPNNRWYKTLARYVELVADKVRALGGDPFIVPATPDGASPLPGTEYEKPGITEDDWPGEAEGLAPPETVKPGIFTGKVSGLLFDHFGDFEGFTLESHDGSHQRLFSREAAIHDLAKAAWIERNVMSVMTVSAHNRRVRRILLRGCVD